MKTIGHIETRDLKEHLIKNWMTHDGMWFYHTLQSCGIDEANRLNRAAIRSLAGIEFRRAMNLFGIPRIDTFEDLKTAVDAAFSVSKGDFMRFTYTFPEENLVRWEWPANDCFAYLGMQKMGVVDRYKCGVIYRILCWLDSAGAEYVVTPDIDGCLMHTQGRCSGSIRIFFPPKKRDSRSADRLKEKEGSMPSWKL